MEDKPFITLQHQVAWDTDRPKKCWTKKQFFVDFKSDNPHVIEVQTALICKLGVYRFFFFLG